MKVLISDDEHHVIQAIRLLVPWEEFGIDKIYTASNGMEALDIITREVPEIVITDIVMEDKNGIDIMDFIATCHPSIKVIAVSGHNDFEYVRTMLTKGCMDYLLKPLESATLISTVGKAVQSWKDEHESNLRHRHLQERYTPYPPFIQVFCFIKCWIQDAWKQPTRNYCRQMHPFHRLTHVKSFITIPAIFQCITQNSPAFLRILNRRYAAALGQSTVLSCPIRIIPEKPCFFCWEPET